MPRTNIKSHRIEESKRLKRLRDFLNLTQREMGKEFGVAHGAVSFWESGLRTIPGPVLKLMGIYEEQTGLNSDPQITSLHASWLSRNIKLSAAAATLAGRFATESAQGFSTKLAEVLSDLKGPMMKIGQMMSYMDFGLPQPARTALRVLQDSSRAVNHDVVENIILQDFGMSPYQLFSQWNVKPFATGSIGQVHKARLHDGTDVAVKVQYPDIARAVSSDLSNTKSISLFFKKHSQLYNELRERLQEECNYYFEAQNQETMARLHKSHSSVVIPKVFTQFSSDKVLTTEFSPGIRFHDFQKVATQEEKNKKAEIIFDMTFRSAFECGIINVDPQPGNFLFLTDKVVFLDFGCMKRVPQAFVTRWREYIGAIKNEQRARAKDLLIEIGYVALENVKRFDFEYHFETMKFLYSPLINPGNFEFTHDYVWQIFKRLVISNPNKYRTQIPKDWLFLNRLQWGLYSILAELRANSNWSHFLNV